nr:hypothetical protein [Tanacetum cinerariifolium]
MSEEVLQAKESLMESIQTFLEKINRISFGEMPKVLSRAWEILFEIQHAQLEDTNELLPKLLEDLQIHDQPEDSNELFQKLLEDLKELAEYKESLKNSSNEIASNSNQEKEGPPQDSDIRQLIREECCIEVYLKELAKYVNSPSRDRPIFSDDNEDHLENSSKEIATSNSNQEKEGPPQDFDIRQLIIEECCIEVSEEQKVIHKSSTSLKNTSQISPVHAVAPILSTKEPEYSPSMGYEHPNTTPKMKSDEIIKSGVEELVPILTENEVTLEDKKEYDMLVCENSPICDDNSEIFSDSNNDDDISSDDDAFEDIEYIEAALFDPEIVSVKEENVVYQEEEETFCDHKEETRSGNTTTHAHDSLPEYVSFCFEIEPDQERLKNDIYDDSSNDILLEEVDLFLASDNSIPQGIENFADDSKGDIRFLEALLIDDSIPFPVNEASDFDNPSFPRPPPKLPDANFDVETNYGEEISVVMNDSDEIECLDPRDEFDNDNYSSFMFVKVFSFLLPAESEDTIFDPGISV